MSPKPRRRKSCETLGAELSEHDKLTEQVIAALKYLTDECARSGLKEYGEIVEDAFERSVKLYVAAHRGELGERLSPGDDKKCTRLN